MAHRTLCDAKDVTNPREGEIGGRFDGVYGLSW
jgi:hypothetical protein